MTNGVFHVYLGNFKQNRVNVGNARHPANLQSIESRSDFGAVRCRIISGLGID